MAEPTQEELAKETFKLVRDNNRMLHAMRRNAFIGGIIKLVTWAILIVLPIWFFATYVAPMLNNAVNTLNQVQGQMEGVQTSVGMEGFNNLLEQFKNIPGIGNFGE